jgi:hypothetical protein
MAGRPRFRQLRERVRSGTMSTHAARFEPPLLLAAGLVAFPLLLIVLVLIPAESTVNLWVDLTIGVGPLALLVTTVVLLPALAVTLPRLVGRVLDAVLFVGVPVLVAVTFWAFSIPGTYIFIALTLSFVWVLLAFLWVARFVFVCSADDRTAPRLQRGSSCR